MPEPLAAALGAGMPIGTPTGNMVVDIGGGTSEAAVISMYGIVVSSSVRVGGNKLDEAIASYVRRKYNLMIGEQTAEEIKINIGSALPLDEELSMEVRGPRPGGRACRARSRSRRRGHRGDGRAAGQIVAAWCKAVLEKTPPELASDIIDRGMVMTRRRGAVAQHGSPAHQGDRRALLRGRGPDGLRGAGRRPGAGELRYHAPLPGAGHWLGARRSVDAGLLGRRENFIRSQWEQFGLWAGCSCP